MALMNGVRSLIKNGLGKINYFSKEDKIINYMRYQTATQVLFKKLPKRVICQEKYNGMFIRMARDGQMYTRTNKWVGAGQVIGWANPTKFDCLGELVCQGNSRKVIGLVSKLRAGTITDEEAEQLNIKWFDCLSGEPFERRLERLWKSSPYEPDYIVGTKKEAYYQAIEFVRRGKEGAMVSDPNAFYEEGVMTNSHLKLKRAYDADFEVVDFKKGDADGSLVVKSRDVKNPIVANVKYHGELYDVCKGCVVTVRFTEALDTSLKSPRLVSLRIDKDIADSKIEIKASKPFIRVN